MKKILIATTNQAKLKEIKSFLCDLPYKLIFLKDINFTKKYQEIGTTFSQIAKNKARFYYNQTKLPTLADDGGLEIDALDGAAGVKSARWLGPKSTDRQLIDHVIEKLKKVPPKKRTARIIVAICLYLSPNKVYLAQGSSEGLIAQKPSPKTIPGFPYRSLLWFPQFNKYYDKLTLNEHDKINHRKIALEKIRKILLNNYK